MSLPAFLRAGVVVGLVVTGLVATADTAAAAPADGLIAYTRLLPGSDPPVRVVRTVDPSTGAQAWAGSGYGPGWSPDGERLAFINNSDRVVIKGSSGLIFTGVRATNSVSWSPDGHHLAFTFADEVWVMNATKPWHAHRVGLMAGNTPSWAPDSRRLVYVAIDIDLHVINVDGTGDINITNSAAEEVCPAWSPDGKSIAYLSNANDQLGVYVANADGTGGHLVAPTIVQGGPPAWSPSGTRLAFSDFLNFRNVVSVINTDGTNRRVVVLQQISYGPAWQPVG